MLMIQAKFDGPTVGRVYEFGPFRSSNRDEAERCVVALAGRINCIEAVIVLLPESDEKATVRYPE